MTAPRSQLLLYLASARDPQRLAVGPALAAVAERAGWAFEIYHAAPGRGRHFGGGDPAAGRPGVAAGGLVAGGRHGERAFALARRYAVAALGDANSPLWPALLLAGAEPLLRDDDPAELYKAALERLGQDVPSRAYVLDGAPQGPHDVVTAPYLYPALLAGPPALALEVTATAEQRSALERMGVRDFETLGVGAARAAAFPGGLDACSGDPLPVDEGWTVFTAAVARRYAHWGEGVLLADPVAVGGQLARARRLRLVAVHGRPQTAVVAELSDLVKEAAEPVYGRQWDDRDFFALGELGHGLQVVDPSPPFDAVGPAGDSLPEPPYDPRDDEPDDYQLERWADEGRVLATLLLWCGMVRELDCVPRLIDLAVETDLRGGIVITADTVEYGGDDGLALVSVPPDRGGVLGRLELVLGSTGLGVAAEAELPEGALSAHLTTALNRLAERVPRALMPRGWWPLLDAGLVPHDEPLVGLRGRRPVVHVRPRAGAETSQLPPSAAPRRDLRAVGGRVVRRSGLGALVDAGRPYDWHRPGALDVEVFDVVREAGFEYMWTKTAFGTARAAARHGDFVALPFTAGNWDGWSPFYTVGSVADVRRAERRLRRAGAGWLASTVDTPLFALSGEVWEHGSRLHEIARTIAGGGASGELVNVTPAVVARYARLLAERTFQDTA